MKKIILVMGAGLGIFAVSLGNSKTTHIGYAAYSGNDTLPKDTTKKLVSYISYLSNDTLPSDTTKHK